MITLALDARSARFHSDERAPSAELALGPDTLRQGWRGDLPTASELESAIERVEDLVMPLHRQWPGGETLHLATPFGLPGLGPSASRDEVEALFQRAAAIALGRPRSSDPELAEPQVLAVLLVLREVMHHLGFTRVALSDR